MNSLFVVLLVVYLVLVWIEGRRWSNALKTREPQKPKPWKYQ